MKELKEIKTIEPYPLAKLLGLFGILNGIFSWIYAWILDKTMPSLVDLGLAIVTMAVTGFLGGFVIALLYGLFAKWVGGIKISF